MRLDTKEKRAEAKAFYTKGRTKVAPKGVPLEFYLADAPGFYTAMCFIGTAAKPAWRYRFKTPEQRAAYMARQIENTKARAASMAAYKAKREVPSRLEIGHILVTCWGYDQTNREFFKVIAKKGDRTVIVQELAQISEETGFLNGKCFPAEEFRTGSKPITCRVMHGDGIKVEGHHASLWDGHAKAYSNTH